MNFYTHDELTNTFTRVFLSTNPSITKTSPNSVYTSLAAGIAALAQKTLKEHALIETYLDPDRASGVLLGRDEPGTDRLNRIAIQRGVPERQTEGMQSVVWVRIVAEDATIFTEDHVFTGDHGIRFKLADGGFTKGSSPFTYKRLVSEGVGVATNVTAFSINRVESPPVGFSFVINETPSVGGRDAETDDQLRYRIKNFANILSFNTITKIGFLANTANQKIFRVYDLGKNDLGEPSLGVITHNGAPLTPEELTTLSSIVRPQVALSDSNLTFVNLEPKSVELEARVQLTPNAVSADVFNRVQLLIINFFRELVYRGEANFLDWVQIYNLVALDPDILSVSSSGFLPNSPIDLSDRRPLQLTRASFLTLDGRSPIGTATTLESAGGDSTLFFDADLDYSLIRRIGV